MRVVVGLGNPGETYQATRHNVGFMVVDEMRRRSGRPREEKVARCALSRARVGGSEVVLARPLTYMNRSGAAVAAVLERECGTPQDLLVVCDDLYLELGVVRLRGRGGHGGHRGLLSIIEALGTEEFSRLRIGVGPAPPEEDHADFVLAPVLEREAEQLPEVIARAADCAETVLRSGLVEAMNRFNRRTEPEPTSGRE